MTSENDPPLSHAERAALWLARADECLAEEFDHMSPAQFATTAALLGTGYAHLAATEVITAKPEPRLVLRHAGHVPAEYLAGLERALQASQEARPHDEPVNLCETDADAARRFAGQVGDLTSRIDDALSWLDQPANATPEVQLAKIRAALEGKTGANHG